LIYPNFNPTKGKKRHTIRQRETTDKRGLKRFHRYGQFKFTRGRDTQGGGLRKLGQETISHETTGEVKEGKAKETPTGKNLNVERRKSQRALTKTAQNLTLEPKTENMVEGVFQFYKS